MHALCYSERPDVGAVVHAHPRLPSPWPGQVSPVRAVLSGVLPRARSGASSPYSTLTTDEVPRVLRAVRRANAIVMHRHGALTVGRTLHEAWHRMETLEHSARSSMLRGSWSGHPDRHAQAAQLEQLARRIGIPAPSLHSGISTARPRSSVRNLASKCAHQPMRILLSGTDCCKRFALPPKRNI